MSRQSSVIEACFAASPNVRYVAAYLHGALELRSRDDVQLLGSNESDGYEELIVNPTLLTLVTQRGNIDCGGMRYVLIRYGLFFALVYPVPGGHVTISLEPEAPLEAEIPRMLAVVDDLFA